MKHIIVVGSGIAGLIAALELSRKHAVTLVTKAQLEDSNARFAQGGIAAAMFSDDSVEEHIADTLRAGAGLCDPAAVEVLCVRKARRASAISSASASPSISITASLPVRSKPRIPAPVSCTQAATPPALPSSSHWLAPFAPRASR